MSKPGAALKDLSQATEAIVAATASRVVGVHARDWLRSSGLILKPGVIVTAEETVDRDEEIEITLPDGKTVAATLIGRDPSTDVAVLRYDSAEALEPFPIAPSVKAGALVIAVGRTGSAPLAALGMIASAGEPWRSSQGGLIDAYLRIDIGLTRTGEGGALVDGEGRLVGMPVFGPRRRVIAIPATTLTRAAEHILAHGSVSRGYLGVGVQRVDLEKRDGGDGRGAMVNSVDAKGPAKAAGIMLGDVIDLWNGEPLGGPRGLINRLGPDSVGGKVELGIVRAGKPMTLTVTIAARPKA